MLPPIAAFRPERNIQKGGFTDKTGNRSNVRELPIAMAVS